MKVLPNKAFFFAAPKFQAISPFSCIISTVGTVD